jgi:hypothetical protein
MIRTCGWTVRRPIPQPRSRRRRGRRDAVEACVAVGRARARASVGRQLLAIRGSQGRAFSMLSAQGAARVTLVLP